MARDHAPHAITLDISLPDIDGWRVLDRLKNDVATRHVPVCIISTDDAHERALQSGAAAFLAKPIQSKEILDEVVDAMREYVERGERRVLLVDPDAAARERLYSLLGDEELEVVGATGVDAAAEALETQRFDCVVVGVAAAEEDPGELAELLARQGVVGRAPVVVYDENPPDEDERWRRLASVTTLRRVQSPDRLRDQVAFLLHREVSTLEEESRTIIESLHRSNRLLAGKKVLVVDDDMRNIFALTTVLEEHDMVVVSADNGHAAIDTLKEESDIDIVLMDIMMPEMDGIDTMREIRRLPTLKGLPIIAVTAKAMKGDREKCIEAGAWDYLAKPVDTEQLMSVLCAWLHR